MTNPSLPHLATPAAPWPENLDPDRVAAGLVSALYTRGLDGTEGAFRAMAQLNADLQDKPVETIRQSLVRQAVILEALFQTNTRDAMQAAKPEHAERYTTTAVRCQKALLGVQGALHKLSEGARHVVDED